MSAYDPKQTFADDIPRRLPRFMSQPVIGRVCYFFDRLYVVFGPGRQMPRAGLSVFGPGQTTAIPLAYGAFCAAYDSCMAGYFFARGAHWNAAWTGAHISTERAKVAFPPETHAGRLP
jgi:hypothetical protein